MFPEQIKKNVEKAKKCLECKYLSINMLESYCILKPGKYFGERCENFVNFKKYYEEKIRCAEKKVEKIMEEFEKIKKQYITRVMSIENKKEEMKKSFEKRKNIIDEVNNLKEAQLW